MDNNANPITGSKGVFPGQVPQAPQAQVPQPGQEYSELINDGQQFIAPGAPVAAPENNNSVETYIKLETKNSEGQVSGILEIDLISFRERGTESRYLSVNLVGSGKDGNQSDTTISIDNETDFNRFKSFISNLNWND
jgi:hypothetical protein